MRERGVKYTLNHALYVVFIFIIYENMIFYFYFPETFPYIIKNIRNDFLLFVYKTRSLAHATELDSMPSSSSCVNSLGHGLLNSPTVLYLSRSFQWWWSQGIAKDDGETTIQQLLKCMLTLLIEGVIIWNWD